MSILIGDHQLSKYRIKKMIDTNDKFEATKLRGWHGFWKNNLHINWFGTKEREKN